MNLLKTLCLSGALLALNLTRLPAQVATWTGAAGSEWNTAGNWDIGVPGVGTNAFITVGSTVNYNLVMSAASLGTLTNDGTVNVNTNGFNPAGINMTYSSSKLFLNPGAVAAVTGNLALCTNSTASMSAGTALTVSGGLILGSDIAGGTSGATASANAYGSLTNFGGALTVGSVSLNPRNGSIATSCRLVIAGGTNSLGAYSAQRSPGGASAPPALGTDGLVVSNGFVNTTSISIGNNAHGMMYLVGGVVTNTGNLTLKNATSTRPARFLQTGGLFVDTDPSQVILTPGGAGGDMVYTVQGGTNIVGGLEFGNGTYTGTVYFTNAASMYVGSQGIVSNGLVVLNTSLNNGGSFGATANWTGSAAMKLISGVFTFSPADLAGTGHTITLSGALGGAGGVLVTNAGTLVLASTNTYTGNTTVSTNGALQLGDGANNNGVVAGNITNYGVLTVANPYVQTITTNLLGSGSLVEIGPGTLILGTNTYAGGTTISGGTLQLGDGATFDGAVPGNLTDNATLAVANPTDQTLSSVISGGGSLIKSGAGVLTLAANEIYTGTTTINGGSLVVAPAGSLATTENVTISSGGLFDVSASTSGGYTLGSGSTFTAGHTSGSGPDFNGKLISDGTVNVPASATFTLNGNLSLLNGGTSEFNLGSLVGSGSTIILNGGVLTLNGTTTVEINFGTLGVGTYPLISGAGSVVGGLANLSLVLNGSLGLEQASLQVTATGVNLKVTGNPHNLVWQGDGSANSWDNYSANTDWINTATRAADDFVSGYYVTFNDTGAANQPILNAAVAPAWTTINGTSSYTFSGGGSISSGSLTNNSTGTLYIQTANTYSGGTTINAGTVEVDNGGSLGTGRVVNNAALTFNSANGNNVAAITGSGAVTVENGPETLSAANTYAGGTTITSATLELGAANAIPGGAEAGDVTNNGTLDLAGYNDTINALTGSGTVDTVEGGTPTLTVGANGDSATFSGIIQNSSGSLSLAKSGSGTEVLGNANTYSGNTTISNGTLSLGIANALPTTTKVVLGGNGTAGILDLGGNSQLVVGLAVGSGAVAANQIIGNSSTTSPSTLIITNSGTVTFGGRIQDVLGAGSENVGLTLNGGNLILNGTNSYSGVTTINSGGNTLLTVSGGFLSASNLVMNSASNSLGFLLSGGTASFAGNVNFSADNGNNGNYMDLVSGTFNAGSFTSGRCNLSLTTQPTSGQASTEGIYVNGATMNITNNLGVGGGATGSGNSSTSLRMDAGAINVGGTTIITINNATRWSVLDLDGGKFTSTDTTGAGIQIGGVYAGAEAELLIRGGVVSANTITLGDATQTSGTDVLNMTNATLYLGTGGIVSGNSSPAYTESVRLASATVGASGSWSSSLPMTLVNTVTFQAADANSNAFDIALNGVLSGSSGLTKTGGGTLTLGAADTYTGNTTINGGTLAIGASGSIASLNLMVGTNAIMDVSQPSAGFTLGGSQNLKGFGTVNGLVTVASGGTIYPGSNVLTGTLTLAGGLAENGGVNNTFYLTNNPALPNNDFISVPGSLAISGQNIIQINGTVLAGGVYPLISYAGGTFSGSTANFTVTGANGSLSNSASAQVIYFIAQSSVRAPASVTWLGSATNQNWDAEVSSNWLNTGTSLTDIFVPGDSALFSNLGGGHPLVTVAGTVIPGSILVNSTANYTFAGTGSIGGTGGLTVSNSALTVLTTNTFTGPTVIQGGTLVTTSIAGSGSPSGIGAASSDPANLILSAGTLGYAGGSAYTDHGIMLTNGGGTLDIAAGSSLTLSGPLTGGGTLTKADSGTLILGVADTYTNSTAIDGGVLQINSAAAVSTAAITFSNGALAYYPSGGITVANPLNFAAGTTNMIVATSSSGANPISSGVWSGAGVLLLSNSVLFTVNGVLDSFTGTILMDSPNGSVFRFNSGGGNSSFGSLNATFDLGANSAGLTCRNAGTMNLGALAGGSATTVTGQGSDSGTATWSIGNNNLNTTFAGIIANGATTARISAVTKVGTGTLTLAGQNTYTGPTLISSGGLALAFNPTNSTDGSIASSTPITLASGAVLNVSGRSDGTFPLGSSQSLTGPGLLRGSLDASGAVTPGGTLTVTNSVILESSATITLNLNRASSPNSDRIAGSHAISYGGTLVVNNVGAVLQAGDKFTLFPSTVYSNTISAFSSVTLPTLSGDLTWNTNDLAVDGSILVQAPVPPSFSSVTTSGHDLILQATGGTPGGAITVLSSTNLTLSLSQWTTVITGNFDSNGNFSYTVSGALSSGLKQQYFIFENQ